MLILLSRTTLYSKYRTTPNLTPNSSSPLVPSPRALQHRFLSSSIYQFPSHVVALAPRSPPTTRSSLRHTHSVNNNHGNPSAIYRHCRVPSNSSPRTTSPSLFPSLPPSSSHSRRHFTAIAFCRLGSLPSSSILVGRRTGPRTLRFPPFPLLHPRFFSPASSRMFVSTERLSSAWRHSPMKWNPLPWFVGVLLLIFIQYRRHRSEKEVHVDEDGYEVIKLKGPLQVGNRASSFFFFFCRHYHSLFHT
jgi:hypothetical protein